MNIWGILRVLMVSASSTDYNPTICFRKGIYTLKSWIPNLKLSSRMFGP